MHSGRTDVPAGRTARTAGRADNSLRAGPLASPVANGYGERAAQGKHCPRCSPRRPARQCGSPDPRRRGLSAGSAPGLPAALANAPADAPASNCSPGRPVHHRGVQTDMTPRPAEIPNGHHRGRECPSGRDSSVRTPRSRTLRALRAPSSPHPFGPSWMDSGPRWRPVSAPR